MFARISALVLVVLVSACSTIQPQGDERRARESVARSSAPETYSAVTLTSAQAADDLIGKGLLDPAETGAGFEKRALFRSSNIEWGDHGWLSERQPDEIRVHSLPVGAGSCHLIECPGSETSHILVDCGTGHSEAGAQVSLSDIASYLHTVVGEAPVKVVISHPHFDHYRYVPELVPPTQVHSLWLGGLFAKYPKPVIDWADAVRDFGDIEMPRVAEQFEPNWHNDGYAVEDLACGDAASFVLTVNSGSNENANSLMLSIDHGDFRAIFTGDAEGATEAAAMANFPDAGVLVSTVVVSSHHGAKTHGSNGEAWIAATQPLIVLHSVGTQYGHPKCDVTERFQSVGSLLPAKPHMMSCDGQAAHVSSLAEYSTHESGAVVITSDASLERLRVECHPNQC